MSKSSFDLAFEATLGHEGGYVFHPADPGGETNWGISKRSYPFLDIKSLTLDQAKSIYRRDYWDKLKLSMVSDAEIAAELFDTGVNMGTGTATSIAQKALNYLGSKVGIDGAMGMETISALNMWATKDRSALVKVLNGLQFMSYYEQVKTNPSKQAFARGWMKRISFGVDHG